MYNANISDLKIHFFKKVACDSAVECILILLQMQGSESHYLCLSNSYQEGVQVGMYDVEGAFDKYNKSGCLVGGERSGSLFVFCFLFFFNFLSSFSFWKFIQEQLFQFED